MSKHVEAPNKQCVSCKAELPANAVICVNCGFNFKTNHQMFTQVGEALPTPGHYSANLVFAPPSMAERIGGILRSKITLVVLFFIFLGGGCYYCKNTVAVGIAEPVYAVAMFQGVQPPPYSKETIKECSLPPDCMMLGGDDAVVLMHRTGAASGNYLLIPVRMTVAWAVANKLDGRYHGFLNSKDFELVAGSQSLRPVIMYQRLPARFSMDMLAAKREQSRFAGYVDNEKTTLTYPGELFYFKNFQPGITDGTVFNNDGSIILFASPAKDAQTTLKYQAVSGSALGKEVALAGIKFIGMPPFSDFKFSNCVEEKKDGYIYYSAADSKAAPQISLATTLRYVIEGQWRLECDNKTGCESWLSGNKFENDKGYMPQPVDVCLLFQMPSPADKPYTLKMYGTVIGTIAK